MSVLEDIIDEIIKNNPKTQEAFDEGDESSAPYLMGCVLVETQGVFNPTQVLRLVNIRLEGYNAPSECKTASYLCTMTCGHGNNKITEGEMYLIYNPESKKPSLLLYDVLHEITPKLLASRFERVEYLPSRF